MIKYVSHSCIDKSKWDICVGTSGLSLPYGFSWYLDSVSPGWDALIMDDYRYVFPLTYKNKFGFRYLCQPPFTQQLGVFGPSPGMPDAKAFLSVIPHEFRLIEISLNESNHLSSCPDFIAKSRHTYHLGLLEPFHELQKRFSENHKRNLKKSSSRKYEIKEHAETDAIIDLFLKDKKKTIGGIAKKNRKILKEIIASAQNAGCQIHIPGIFLQGSLVCGGIFIHFNERIIFLFSGTLPNEKKFSPLAALIEHVISKNAETAKKLDFEGSDIPGLARFYRSFGSKEIVYLHVKKNRLPSFIRWLKN
jgi:hypothetical protein